jgi:hypothetical protein
VKAQKERMEFASEVQLSSTDPKPTVAHVVTIRYSDLLVMNALSFCHCL